LAARVTNADGKPVADAVVIAVPETGAPPRTGKPTIEVVDQIGKEFTPYVKVVRVGSSVSFPNKDNVRHHVYSFSPAKTFELPLYKGTPAEPVQFDKPGVVRIGCNIHDWMIGYIYVVETPYAGKTGKHGVIELEGLPPGRYRVRVWHPWMDDAEQATETVVDVKDGAFTPVEWKLRLKPELAPRRAPLPGETGYR
jgi:plastocyanin